MSSAWEMPLKYDVFDYATYNEFPFSFLPLFLNFLPLQFRLDFAMSRAVFHGKFTDQFAKCINLKQIKNHNNES